MRYRPAVGRWSPLAHLARQGPTLADAAAFLRALPGYPLGRALGVRVWPAGAGNTSWAIVSGRPRLRLAGVLSSLLRLPRCLSRETGVRERRSRASSSSIVCSQATRMRRSSSTATAPLAPSRSPRACSRHGAGRSTASTSRGGSGASGCPPLWGEVSAINRSRGSWQAELAGVGRTLLCPQAWDGGQGCQD